MALAVFVLGLTVFCVGTTEVLIAGILPLLSADLDVSVPTVGLLISGYALGVVIGGPLLTVALLRTRKKTALAALIGVFVLGQTLGALAPSYAVLMAARVVTALAQGAFFGIGTVVAVQIAGPEARAKALAIMFGGLTMANVIGAPIGTFIGQHLGWRASFWAVDALAVLSLASILLLVPPQHEAQSGSIRQELTSFRKPRVWSALAVTALSQAGLFSTVSYLAPLLIQDSRFDASLVPLFLCLFGIGCLAGTFLGGHFADRHLRANLHVGPDRPERSAGAARPDLGQPDRDAAGVGARRRRSFLDQPRAASTGRARSRRSADAGGHDQHLGVQRRQHRRAVAGRPRHRRRARLCGAGVGRRPAGDRGALNFASHTTIRATRSRDNLMMTTPGGSMSQKQPTTVAVLGTGIIGSGVARNLSRKGFAVTVWNRTRAKADQLRDDGAQVASGPAEAVRGADVILTTLNDGRRVLEAMTAAAPAVRPGAVWAQLSTVGIDALRPLVELAEEHGLRFVDSPVQGTKQPAEQGQLILLAAGAPDTRVAVQPVFDAIGKRTLWVAETSGDGAASRLKLVLNSWAFALTHGIGEALALAKGLDVKPEHFLDVVTDGPMDNVYFQLKSAAITGDDYTPSFSVVNAEKDSRLVAEASEAAGVRNDVAVAGWHRFQRAVADGHGDKDMAASYLASFANL